ncbi:MAG: phytanoyl-CoA dioxygenase family protein [Synechococcaceae cyanobacterium ELA445]
MNLQELVAAATALDSQGYWQWKRYLDHCETEAILSLLSTVPALHNDQDSKLGECISYPNLLELDNELFRITLEPRLNQLVHYYFQREAYGEEFPYQLARLQYRNLISPCDPQHLHLDSRLPGVWPSISLHCFLYLSDVASSDGPTEVVPGSHRMPRYPNESDRNLCIPILANRGDLLVLHSSLWHSSSRKISSTPRPIVAFAYNRWWMHQQFLFPYTEHLHRRDDLTAHDKEILGFRNYPPARSDIRIAARGELPNLSVPTPEG